MKLCKANDLIDHKTEGLDCKCGPMIDWEYHIVVHAAIDGRDVFEKETWNGSLL